MVAGSISSSGSDPAAIAAAAQHQGAFAPGMQGHQRLAQRRRVRRHSTQQGRVAVQGRARFHPGQCGQGGAPARQVTVRMRGQAGLGQPRQFGQPFAFGPAGRQAVVDRPVHSAKRHHRDEVEALEPRHDALKTGCQQAFAMAPQALRHEHVLQGVAFARDLELGIALGALEGVVGGSA